MNANEGILWTREFPGWQVPEEISGLVLDREFVDCSWHNDVAPTFIRKQDEAHADGYERPTLWVDHPDVNERELGEVPRFRISVGQDSDIYFETDVLAVALTVFRGMDRFAMLIGPMQVAIERLYGPAVPDGRGGLVLWDVQEGAPVGVIYGPYAQFICLERTESAGISGMVAWLNKLAPDAKALESEGIKKTFPMELGDVWARIRKEPETI